MIALSKIVAGRLLLGIVTLLITSMVIFGAMELLPGDFAQAVLGQSATEETVRAFRAELQLDQPVFVRYFDWLLNALQGDFGQSFSGRASSGYDRSRAVVDLVAPRMSNTILLAGLTAAISVPLALGLGFAAVLYHGSWFDRALNWTVLGAISFPEFLIAYALILLLASLFPVFPALANVSPDMAWDERLSRMALPAASLTIVIMAHMMRMTRAALNDLMARPYVETAKLKGLSRRRIVLVHVLPNAWAPIATVIAFNLAYLIVGVVVVEVVFAYPGIGQLMVDAVTSRDIPVVQTCALVFAGTYIVLNLLADVIAIMTNPRLLHPK